jgi:hypothetical protein
MSDSRSPEIAELHRFRRAARALVRDAGLSTRGKHIALARLAERARSEAELPGWAQEAVCDEARAFLECPAPSDVPPFPGPPVESAARRLRGRGLSRCPECRRVLPNEVELRRWATYRRWRIEELATRAGAVR